MHKKQQLGNVLLKSKNKNTLKKKAYIKKMGAEENNLLDKQPKLQSVLERDNLNDFLYQAEIANKKFEAYKEKKVIIKENLLHQKIIKKEGEDIDDITIFNKFKKLRIPRRPDWKGKTAEEQILDENKNFINWCKDLAELKQNSKLIITPYEKNVEVWKQLWRVIEKSDILIQIVDSRNPLFFRNEDLENYAKELDPNKSNILLLNKADLINEEVKEKWVTYLNNNNIDFILFSSKDEQLKIDAKKDEHEEILEDIVADYKNYLNSKKVLSRLELLQFLKLIKSKNHSSKKEIIIGTIGYPNVGKSSLINVLCGKKLVGVASRPGKTKNFQTIILSKEITLCDSPGLVFPNIVNSKSEMVMNGVIPIDNLKEYLEHIQLIFKMVDLNYLKEFYKLKYIGNTERSFLMSLCGTRGYANGSGNADEFKAAKIVLKDIVEGKLSYSILPDGSFFKNKLFDFEKEIEDIKNISDLESKKLFKINVFNDFYKECGLIKDININKEDFEKEEIINNLTENDLFELLKGKTVMGLKLNKDVKRELKFAIKQNKDIEELESIIKKSLFENKKQYNVFKSAVPKDKL